MKILLLLLPVVGAVMSGCSKQNSLPNPPLADQSPHLSTISNTSSINLTIGTANYFLVDQASFLISDQTVEISGNNQFYLYVPFNPPLTDTINCKSGALLMYIDGGQFYECDTASVRLIFAKDTLRGTFNGTFSFNDSYFSLYKTNGTLAQIPLQ